MHAARAHRPPASRATPHRVRAPGAHGPSPVGLGAGRARPGRQALCACRGRCPGAPQGARHARPQVQQPTNFACTHARMQTRAPLAPVARCRPGGGRCGPGPAAARLGGLPGLRCGARGTARQVQLTDCAWPWLARTERCNRGAVHSCTGGVGQEQAVWAWARRCAAEGRPGAPGDASRRRLRATNRACPSHTPAATGVL